MALSTYNGFPGEYRERVQAELTAMWSSGLWEPPGECAVCYQTGGAIHGHLEDYSQPETYVPLCIICHLIVHARFREPELFAEYRRWICDGNRPDAQTQNSGFVVMKTRFRPSNGYQGWPGATVNKPVAATFLDGLAPVRFIHPHAPRT
ncbi:hypothetical protein [Nocardia terpenica]|uniref:hypothetical protein n=1 Tax=Nocardia terpenica TaxID=455432 RepID=UPI000B017190|nr:hypothetical protein [Nocardia terpenica]NQE86286.1 hypothetical protein [Nocardia terpenica]